MANPNNNNTAIGRVAGDPVRFVNSDGSSRVKFSVYSDRNFTNRNGEIVSDIIPLDSGYLGPDQVGPFGRIHKGDQVAVTHEVRSRPYEKDGETVYPAPTLEVQNVQFLEKKAVTETRLAERVTKGEVTVDDKGFATKAAQANAQAVAAAQKS